MRDTVDIMAEEFKIAYPLTYDAIYNKGKADAIDDCIKALKSYGKCDLADKITLLEQLKGHK